MDMSKFLKKYQNDSTKNLEKIRENTDLPVFDRGFFEYNVRSLDDRRAQIKKKGRAHVRVGPLLQIKSVSVLLNENKPLAVYGRIFGEVCDVDRGRMKTYDRYNRGCDDMKLLGPNGSLTLISLIGKCLSHEICLSRSITRIVVKLFQESRNVLISESLSLDNTSEDDYKHVKLKKVRDKLVYLVTHNVAIPNEIFGRVSVSFYERRFCNEIK